MRLLLLLCACLVVVHGAAEIKYDSYLDKLTRYSFLRYLNYRQTDDEYTSPSYDYRRPWLFKSADVLGADINKLFPHVRLDFGVTSELLGSRDGNPIMNITYGTHTREISSQLFYVPWNEFRVVLFMNTGRKVDPKQFHVYSLDLHDTNFPCNGNDELETKSWAFYGRQIMFSVYYDDTSDDYMYVFVNVNDDICEYHIKVSDFKMGTAYAPTKVTFERFQGMHLEPPSGYKIVQPLMSVDSAARTLNYVVVSISGPVSIKLISYRFYSQGPGKPLIYELYDLTRDRLYSHKYDKFHGMDGGNNLIDDHSLDFLRDYNFRTDYGTCGSHMNGLLSSFNCIHFLDVFYNNNEVYAMMGRPARKHSCVISLGAPHIERTGMYLEAGHCKYRPGIHKPLQNKSKP